MGFVILIVVIVLIVIALIALGTSVGLLLDTSNKITSEGVKSQLSTTGWVGTATIIAAIITTVIGIIAGRMRKKDEKMSTAAKVMLVIWIIGVAITLAGFIVVISISFSASNSDELNDDQKTLIRASGGTAVTGAILFSIAQLIIFITRGAK